MQMKLAWLTDIHLNFLEVESRQKYYIMKQRYSCLHQKQLGYTY